MNSTPFHMIFKLLDPVVEPDQIPHDPRPDEKDDRQDNEHLILTEKIHHNKPHDW